MTDGTGEWKCRGCGATFRNASEFLRWDTPRGEVTGHRRADFTLDYTTGRYVGSGEEITCGPVVAVAL